MKLQTLIIGVLIGSLFMVLLGLVMGDVSSKQSVTYSNETQIYDTINDSYNEYLDLQSKFNTTTDTSSNLDILGSFLDRGIAAVKITYSSTGNAITLTSQGADEIGIPFVIQLAMISFILVFIIIILVKLFTRSDI